MTAETESPLMNVTEAGRDLTRRRLLRGAAVTGVALPVLAACGGADEPAGSTPDAAASSSGGDGGQSEPLAATGDVPSGGGTILAEEEVVLTQPADGDFKAFTAICTHRGCVVASVADGTINCDCHGSKFSIEDGSVAAGPATSPLDEIAITVDGDQIIRD